MGRAAAGVGEGTRRIRDHRVVQVEERVLRWPGQVNRLTRAPLRLLAGHGHRHILHPDPLRLIGVLLLPAGGRGSAQNLGDGTGHIGQPLQCLGTNPMQRTSRPTDRTGGAQARHGTPTLAAPRLTAGPDLGARWAGLRTRFGVLRCLGGGRSNPSTEAAQRLGEQGRLGRDRMGPW